MLSNEESRTINRPYILSRYSFSGHESFHCKSLWLKKGYDFLLSGGRFSDADSVIQLGVGKNMVASIRFWLRAFGLSSADELTSIANFLFNSKTGRDPYSEDLNTLWILHFLLVNNKTASLYNLIFIDYQRERKEFTRNELQTFIRRKCSVPEQKNVYNDNTVKKDISVLLKNYVSPKDLKIIEDFSALLISLNLILSKPQETYTFREVSVHEISPEVILFSLLCLSNNDKTVSLDGLQYLSLIFCLPIISLIEIIRSLEQSYPDTIIFSDNSGIKNVQFLKELNKFEVLDNYYNSI